MMKFKILFLIFVILKTFQSKREESVKMRALTHLLDKNKGVEFNKNINIFYDKNLSNFKCVAQKEMLSQSFAFILNPKNGICLNKVFDRIDELENIINNLIEKENLNSVNLNIVKHLKTDILFSYYINFFNTNSHLNKKMKFQVQKWSINERETIDNLPNEFVNLLSFDQNDFDLITSHLNIDSSQYLHLKESILRILENIEKELKILNDSEYFNKWAVGEGVNENILYNLSAIWRYAIYLNQSVNEIVNKNFQDNLKENNLNLNLNIGIPCIFPSLTFCELPKEIKSQQEESSYMLKSSVMNNKLILTNNHHTEEGKEFSYLFNSEGLSSLDYLLQYGWNFENFPKNFYNLKINENSSIQININNFDDVESLFQKLNPYIRGEALYLFIINHLEQILDMHTKKDIVPSMILNQIRKELINLPKENSSRNNLKRKIQIFEFIKNSQNMLNIHLNHFVTKLLKITKKEIGKTKRNFIGENK